MTAPQRSNRSEPQSVPAPTAAVGDCGNGKAPKRAKTNLASAPNPLAATPEPVRAEAVAMLRAPNLMEQIVRDVAALGVAGEEALTATLYLIGTSRLLDKPLAAIVQGQSSSGKSYVIDRVGKLFPGEAVLRAHRITSQALYHLPPGSLVNRFVVAGERPRRQDDETADATRALREMISDGRLTKAITVKVRGSSDYKTKYIDQPGPIAYVESTTVQLIFDEDRNRCLILPTDETPAQTRRILDTTAARKVNPDATGTGSEIIAKHHAAQRLLRRVRVSVPYAEELARHFPDKRTEARRAFPQLVSMIEAVTLLHQFQRVAEPEDGLVITATAQDYRIARRLLVGPFSKALGARQGDAVRRFGDRLREAFADGREFGTADVAEIEGVPKDVQTVRQYVRELAKARWLEQAAPPEGKKPARYRIVTDPPDEATLAGLPDPNVLFVSDPTYGATAPAESSQCPRVEPKPVPTT